MVINTSVGVATIDKDLVNVSQVLRLPPLKHVRKIVIPASIPMIFTGMRLSLGIAWMVLIAAEMLAQNPGLGKFVWDEFQNGSSESLSRIMAAVVVIGFIGFIGLSADEMYMITVCLQSNIGRSRLSGPGQCNACAACYATIDHQR